MLIMSLKNTSCDGGRIPQGGAGPHCRLGA